MSPLPPQIPMPAPVRLNPGGSLIGPVATSTRTLADLDGVFADEVARGAMPPGTVVYRVESFTPVDPGTNGGLFFGTSFLEAGRVGDEFFMTRGHVHERTEAAEFYWGIEGEGVLLMMDEDREVRAETVMPGSVHYVPGRAAHRLVNTGSRRLAVGACWLADAGHDYGAVGDNGFAVRVRLIDGEPQLINVDV